MHPLDEKLEELVLKAQLHFNDPPRRRRVIQELWDIMLPSRRRPPQPTDDEARRRLGGLKNSCRNIYGSKLEGDFEEDWPDVLQEAQTEVLTKIDIYKKGVDSQLYTAWLNFGKTLPSQPNPEVYSEFQNQVEKFRNRFIQRRTKKVSAQKVMIFAFHLLLQSGSYKILLLLMHDYPKKKNGMIVVKPYPQEKAQHLSQICENFCNSIQTNEIDLQHAWNTFCDEVQKLYRSFKFWNWFASYIKYRFIDMIRKRVKEVSADAPDAKEKEDSKAQTRLDKIQDKADSGLSQQQIKLIYEDPDRIFTGKHIKNFPEENFRAIAILKFRDATLQEIGNHFNHAIIETEKTRNRNLTEEEKKKLYAQAIISSFYTRACYYFKPILGEYLEARIALPQPVIEQIINDSDGKYNKRRMPDHSQITFKGIIEARLSGVQSWKILAHKLQVDVKDLIYFYLDSISYFKLMTKPKTRTRKSKKNSEAEINN